MNDEHEATNKLEIIRPSQALEILQQVCGDNTVSCIHVFLWHKRVRDGREELNMFP